MLGPAGHAGHAGYAGYGHYALHSRFCWGLELYLACTPDGMPVIWGLANPWVGEREATEALLTRDHHLVAAGQVILGDKASPGRSLNGSSSKAPAPT